MRVVLVVDGATVVMVEDPTGGTAATVLLVAGENKLVATGWLSAVEQAVRTRTNPR